MQTTEQRQGYVISHDDFPNSYPDGINASLTITGLQRGQMVEVKYITFDLYYRKNHYQCYDYLRITGSTNGSIKYCSHPGHKPMQDLWYGYEVQNTALAFHFFSTTAPGTVDRGFYFYYKGTGFLW